MREKQPERPKKPLNCDRGFSLLEVLTAIVILLAALLSLLPVVAGSVDQYRQARQRWTAAVEAWNRAQRLRADPAGEGDVFQPAARALPLKRLLLETDGGGQGRHAERIKLRWEVIHGLR
ncbi:MAG TPA: prepilin-type N-terminal cleavage/methylation domain-containing protein [Acidobacteriota bacterium]|nr:prepilin-type N-terminal cleavage/methylation domain-containing protein [Acidobacteriota bacterium]